MTRTTLESIARAHIANAQRSFYHRVSCNSAARFGDYSGKMEESLS